MDLATRSRAEGQNPCCFLENWIPEALGAATLQPSVVLERAHWIGPVRDTNPPPRTLIRKFLNYKDKQAVVTATRAKKDIWYKDQQVRFYSDLAEGIHQLRKQFNLIRHELRNLGIWNGVTHLARLLGTLKEWTFAFKTQTNYKGLLRKFWRIPVCNIQGFHAPLSFFLCLCQRCHKE